MPMDWASERYIRVFTRDTATWECSTWQQRSMLMHLLRKLDRNGRIDLGRFGVRALAKALDMPEDVTKDGLDHWTELGTLVLSEGVLTMPNFVAAQECNASDALRAKQYRDRKKTETRDTKCDCLVTPSDDESQKVTDASLAVTGRHADEQNRHASSLGVTPPVPPSPPVPPVLSRPESAERDATPSPLALEIPEPKKGKRTKLRQPRTVCPSDVDTNIDDWLRDHGIPTSQESTEVLKFVRWHRKNGTMSADWGASWRTWQAKALQWLCEQPLVLPAENEDEDD